MTTSANYIRLVRGAAPWIGILLLAGCNQQPESTPVAAGVEAAADSEPNELQTGHERYLKPITDASVETYKTLPVAYPASEIAPPLRIARPFPLTDPQFPLPRTELPQSVVTGVQPLNEVPATTDAEQAAVEPDPPTLQGESEQPRTDRSGPPERLPAIFVASTQMADRGPTLNPAPTPMAFPSQPAEPVQAAMPGQRPTAQPTAMRAVSRQAEQLIRHGYYLAERGALYSARADFIQALRTITQAIDVQTGFRARTQALAAGLTALEEAEDFVPEGAAMEVDLDLGTLIHAHRTPVCKQMDAANLLPVTVLQHYFTYAQQQLTTAANNEEAASMALYGLGKTYSTLAIEKSLSAAVAEPKAMVFHWAAISSHGGNFLAANELAVLEARWGQYATARSLLQYSLAIVPHSAVWRNLSKVHQRLGETRLAELAMHEAEISAKREATATPGNPEGIVPSTDVQWLDSKEFASTSRSEIDVQKPAAADTDQQPPRVKATPVVAPAPARQRSAGAWFPWFR
ncbi:MAG TPA: hypothetical protein VHC22_26885 [Pirellulales bacterium]|nr:hypothetical protein [Pirellulales bacterium]